MAQFLWPCLLRILLRASPCGKACRKWKMRGCAQTRIPTLTLSSLDGTQYDLATFLSVPWIAGHACYRFVSDVLVSAPATPSPQFAFVHSEPQRAVFCGVLAPDWLKVPKKRLIGRSSLTPLPKLTELRGPPRQGGSAMTGLVLCVAQSPRHLDVLFARASRATALHCRPSNSS